MPDSISTPGMGAMGIVRALTGTAPALRRGSGKKKSAAKKKKKASRRRNGR